jgi:hypothetical protein
VARCNCCCVIFFLAEYCSWSGPCEEVWCCAGMYFIRVQAPWRDRITLRRSRRHSGESSSGRLLPQQGFCSCNFSYFSFHDGDEGPLHEILNRSVDPVNSVCTSFQATQNGSGKTSLGGQGTKCISSFHGVTTMLEASSSVNVLRLHSLCARYSNPKGYPILRAQTTVKCNCASL